MRKDVITASGKTPFPVRYVYKSRPVGQVGDVMHEFDRDVMSLITHQSRVVASQLRHDQPQKMQLQNPDAQITRLRALSLIILVKGPKIRVTLRPKKNLRMERIAMSPLK